MSRDHHIHPDEWDSPELAKQNHVEIDDHDEQPCDREEGEA